MGETEVDPEAEAGPGVDAEDRPPLGSWAKTYTLTLGFAILCIVLLYWFTSSFNIPLSE